MTKLDEIEAQHIYHRDKLGQYLEHIEIETVGLLIRAVRQLGAAVLNVDGDTEWVNRYLVAIDPDVLELIND